MITHYGSRSADPISRPGAGPSGAPRIGIYAGQGSSHSWLWFVDLFQASGFHNLVFLDDVSLLEKIAGLDVLIISGGDTFAVAGALGREGADAIHDFVDQGGLYIGSCAGAYLPMKSSKKPLDMFNFVDVKITNLSKILPQTVKDSFKFCTSYGCDFIFHPVREEVCLASSTGALPFCPETFTAPLYGGPGMTVPDPAWVIACYNGFTPATSFLVKESLAGEILTGNAAVVRVPMGRGVFYLFGPHLEHPKFPRANRFVIDALEWETGHTVRNVAEPMENVSDRKPITLAGKEQKAFVMDIRREISNSRIVAVNLEFLPIRWMIGKKVYEPEKVRVFLEAIWKRLDALGKATMIRIDPIDRETIIHASRETTRILRHLKRAVDANEDSLGQATELFGGLNRLSMAFFNMVFMTLNALSSLPENHRPFNSETFHNRRVKCRLDQ